MFSKEVVGQLDAESLVEWARAQLNSTNPVGYVFPSPVWPIGLQKHRPVIVQLVKDTQTQEKFVLVAFTFGAEREGLMIGAPDAKINNYGYRAELTNGVYYVLDYN